jgi:pimeloyl-ACP methyl ester carboxylesterase
VEQEADTSRAWSAGRILTFGLGLAVCGAIAVLLIYQNLSGPTKAITLLAGIAALMSVLGAATNFHLVQGRGPKKPEWEPKDEARSVICFIHGLNSSSRTWRRLLDLMRSDPSIWRLFDADTFDYDARIINTGLLSRTPEYITIAEKLATHFVELESRYESIVFVTHSQGGIVLQYFEERLLRNSEARRLSKVKQIVMIACPNLGSTTALRSRQMLTSFVRHPQVIRLAPYNREVAAIHQAITQSTNSGVRPSDREWPIPTLALAGLNDGIVEPVSAFGRFANTGVIDGDHFSVLTPSGQDDPRYKTIRRAILSSLDAAAANQQPGAQSRLALGRAHDDPWLRWVSEESDDVLPALADLLAATSRCVVAIVGGPDFGKTTILRLLERQVRYLEIPSFRFDCADGTLWRDFPADAEVVFLDHVDRLDSPQPIPDAFKLIEEVMGATYTNHVRLVFIALDADWERAFMDAYQMTPPQVMRAAAPDFNERCFRLRPYRDDELRVECLRVGISPQSFPEAHMRRPGILALSRSVGPGARSGGQLRSIHVKRWIQAGETDEGRTVRTLMWRRLGLEILRTGVPSVDAGIMLTETKSLTSAAVRRHVGEPLRLVQGRVMPVTPTVGDVSAAEALLAALDHEGSALLEVPTRRSVLESMIDLMAGRTEEVWASATAELRRHNRVVGAYAAPTVGSLCARLAAELRRPLIVVECDLTGPDPAESPPVEGHLVSSVQASLVTTISEPFGQLVDRIGSVSRESRSAGSGEGIFWEIAREWAASLQLRADAEARIREALPAEGVWRFEDVLDMSVVDASTEVMKRFHSDLCGALESLPDPIHWMLADIWDGLNDGCWDQIRVGHERQYSTFTTPSDGLLLRAERSNFHGAAFGNASIEGWRFLECDLTWADFRSCSNIDQANFQGSNWWTSILPPTVRYALSRSETDPRFRTWGQSPPWSNPYWSATWPTPLGE